MHYWDNQDFNEQSLRLAAGYKNRSAVQSFGIVPFAEQNWLGGKRYNRETGIHTDFSRRLNEKWRLSLNAGYIKKYYRNSGSAARYNSHMPLAGATLAYSAPKKLAALRRRRLVARNDQRSGAGIRAQGHTLRRGESV